jgi:hypothetical protein
MKYLFNKEVGIMKKTLCGAWHCLISDRAGSGIFCRPRQDKE